MGWNNSSLDSSAARREVSEEGIVRLSLVRKVTGFVDPRGILVLQNPPGQTRFDIHISRRLL
jgi:hypothetical protein